MRGGGYWILRSCCHERAAVNTLTLRPCCLHAPPGGISGPDERAPLHYPQQTRGTHAASRQKTVLGACIPLSAEGTFILANSPQGGFVVPIYVKASSLLCNRKSTRFIWAIPLRLISTLSSERMYLGEASVIGLYAPNSRSMVSFPARR